VGGGKLNLAYIASDAEEETWGNGGDIMHTLHANYNKGNWQFEAGVKYYPTNDEEYSGDSDLAVYGYDALIGYKLPGFFGASQGNSKVILQAGAGLASRNLLGASINTYNAYTLYDTPGGADGLAAEQVEGDTSERLILTGDTKVGPFQLFPNLLIQLNQEEDGDDDMLVAFAMREVLPLTKHFSLAFETGIDYLDSDDGVDNDGITYKITMAPTWTVNTGEGPSPEIRLLLSYFGGDDERGFSEGYDGFVGGIQCDLWW
jgi:maltoporin